MLAVLFTFMPLQVVAQAPFTWDDFVEAMYEESGEDGSDDETNRNGWAEHMEELKMMAEHPLDLLTACKDDLERLPFLNDGQVEAILAYVYMHPPKSLSELSLIRELDYTTIESLKLFVTIGEWKHEPEKPSVRKIVAALRSQLDSRVDIPLYYRKGYSVAGGYVGDPLYHRIRYTLGDGRHVSVGAHVEKDAGERYYDAWGAYAMLRGIGRLEKVVAGDYRIGWGEGLVMGGGAWTSKSVMYSRPQQGIRPMTGMDEMGFLRGMAATIRLGRSVHMTAFASHRQLDATLTADGEAQTIVPTGLHRTAIERGKKHNLGSTAMGGDVTWQHGRTQIGAAGFFQSYSRALCPVSTASPSFPTSYRRYYPRGKRFGSMGIHYAHGIYRWYFAGETAYSLGRKGLATTNRVEWLTNERWRITLTQRYYGKGYYSPYAQAVSESGGVRDETGVTLRVQAQGIVGWNMNAYIDLFHNSWPLYRMTHSSTGEEFCMQLSRNINRRNTVIVRYQLKRKETSDVMKNHNRLKLQWTYAPAPAYRQQTILMIHNVAGATGLGVSESVRGRWLHDRLDASMTINYFHTPDYATHIYINEPSLHSTMTSGMLYGHGLRAAVTMRWTTADKRLTLEAKMGSMRYFDRHEQGSNLQTIYSAWRNDISVQAILKV